MSAPAGCQLIGRWRIVEADLWDRGYLDLGGPATITIGADNNGEIAFGALQAGLDLSYSPSMVFFTWAGCDEMDEVTGATVPPNRSTTDRSKSRSHITTATRPSSKPNGILLQQPARRPSVLPWHSGSAVAISSRALSADFSCSMFSFCL